MTSKGIFIAVTGPDGVGKSTLIRILGRKLRKDWPRIYYFHFRPRGAAPLSETHNIPDIFANHQEADSHGLMAAILSPIKLMRNILLFYWSYCRHIRPVLKKGACVIADRYFYNYQIFPASVRYFGPRILAWFSLRLIPRPDILLVLEALPEVIRMRKAELTIRQVQEQTEECKRLVNRLEYAWRVDAGGPIKDVAERAAKIIRKNMQRGNMGERTYMLIGHSGITRIAIPDISSPVAIRGLDLYQPIRCLGKFWHKGVKFALQMGLASHFVDRASNPFRGLIEFDPDEWLRSIEKAIDERDLVMTFYFPPDIRRAKAAGLLLRSNGDPMAFAKFSWSSEAKLEMDNELKGMNFIGNSNFRRLFSSKPLGRGKFGNVEYILMSVMADEVMPAPNKWDNIYLDVWEELDSAKVSHGDYVPWNARIIGGRLFLFDLEEFSRVAPPYLDPIYFALQVEIRLHGVSPRDAGRRVLGLLNANLKRDIEPKHINDVIEYWDKRPRVFYRETLDQIARGLRESIK